MSVKHFCDSCGRELDELGIRNITTHDGPTKGCGWIDVTVTLSDKYGPAKDMCAHCIAASLRRVADIITGVGQ